MQRWKRDYHLLNQKKKLKDESGITLVELLAAISILSVVILLAGSIHMFGQRQFINETESASQSNDLSYAMSVMSRELRQEKVGTVSADNQSISINNEVKYFINGNGKLEKAGGEILVPSVSQFDPTVSNDGESIKIILVGRKQNASDKKYETTIYFRVEESNVQGETE